MAQNDSSSRQAVPSAAKLQASPAGKVPGKSKNVAKSQKSIHARKKAQTKSVRSKQTAKPKAQSTNRAKSKKKAAARIRLKKSTRRSLYLFAALLLVIGLLIFNPFGLHAQLDEGRAFLETLESQNIEDVQRSVLEARRDELNEMIGSGTFSASSIMSDAVIIGDSRAEGFASYEILPSERVLATIGDRADKIITWKDSVEALQPSTIYISYGGNDLSYNTGSELNPDGYAKLYEQQIDELLSVDPNAKIAINSIIEPTPAVAAAEPWWANRDDFNRQLKELCERRGWIYIDNAELSDGGNAPIYDRDGMHFLPAFYEQWAANMAMALIESGL